jgi:protein TonB
METKKSQSANLENKRSLFLQIGLIVALSAVLIAFEWSTREPDKFASLQIGDEVFVDDFMPITRTTTEIKEPPKPEVTLIEIVSDDGPDIDDPVFADAGIKEGGTYSIDKWVERIESETDSIDRIFIRVEDMPRFNGGDIIEFWKYVQDHVIYPEQAREQGLQGRIMVNFVVDQKGEIVNIDLTRRIHPLLDNEVVKTLNEAPMWVPGKQRGRPVKVSFSMPVIFRLEGS